jgi:hypothetical protein
MLNELIRNFKSAISNRKSVFLLASALLFMWMPRDAACRSGVPLGQPSAKETCHRAQGESLTLPVLPCTETFQSLIPHLESLILESLNP